MPQSTGLARSASAASGDGTPRAAARALVRCYQGLAESAAHLLDPVLKGAAPVQWEHYPADDAINRDRRYQWFYHSHTAEDRAGSAEHGHFHLFARCEGVPAVVRSPMETRYLRRLGARQSPAATRHLLSVGLSRTGVPVSLFTVNRWVTGDLPLSGESTVQLLRTMTLETGFPIIDRLLVALVQLYGPEIRRLMCQRDSRLMRRAAAGSGALDDRALEVLSERRIRVDDKIRRQRG